MTNDHITNAFPPFQPFPLLNGPHLQTVSATYLARRPALCGTVQHRVELPDGDQLVLQDDQPDTWRPTDPVAMLIHGISGCHASTYMVRAAAKLVTRGVRSFRLDMRGCGAGWSLARHSMHAGRGDDIQAVIQFLSRLCPHAPRAGVGFSLGGLTLLRAIAEHNIPIPTDSGLTCAMAISPPMLGLPKPSTKPVLQSCHGPLDVPLRDSTARHQSGNRRL